MNLQNERFRQRRTTPVLGLSLVMLLLCSLSFSFSPAAPTLPGSTGFIGQLEYWVAAHTVGQNRTQKTIGNPSLDSLADGDSPSTILTVDFRPPGLKRFVARLQFDALLEGALADIDHHHPPLRAPPLV